MDIAFHLDPTSFLLGVVFVILLAIIVIAFTEMP